MEREPQSAYSRLKAAGLLAALDGRVAEANLYRFCQLLEQALPNHPLLGSSAHPADDPVRFRPDPGMGFPAGELKAIETDEDYPERPATVRTRLLGLYGVDSPMPTTFLDDIAQRREGHEALEAFLDIFNHRIFTQFYRIWRKYSYPATFEAGGADATSQCLLGLIGLGIPGTTQQIATPTSRFLALLSVMRLPTRNAEGITALVKLLAPNTKTRVTPHCTQKVPLAQPASLCRHHPVSLSQGTPLGSVGFDANSQLHLALFTEDLDEARGWLPGSHLHNDLLVLLRVYLGWRCTAKLQLSLPIHSLPKPLLGGPPVLLGMTGVLGLGSETWQVGKHEVITINLGRYQGLHSNPHSREVQHVAYRF
ncbi:type VI secretion system baseplate subunit TssG [Pseudomonas syringae]|uniref:Type VI secretion system baseplate subunit TssG n=5 Tax=Pseudomonas syringae TaxID=317 RepID=A0AAT9SQF7_PSESX|nr:type VI secretion system baseplate subunit TssG [Pseudomonas syringae]EPM43308.1 type VI secretion protein [Pseudomonas syringae pv. actinidiae ICMP 19098]EPN14230.1 type VI secretion protein [Pseudomonas syringae pv. actinidiae ICMP 19100]EPN22878.1 type VI secretion protein [Pseudomonas syringae pv. actinidiae ICMP 19099]EPN29918.1 type VI secretion protein [Pseudomonas syringae pv. actinidiae ICMP 18883]EPN38321.1 type VI secretion protein [Pseudomonas syringae pv. actinidiae ICMP 19095]